MKLLKTILFFVFVPLIGFSQECNCQSNFNWLKQTIENNDAGFDFVIKTKGINAYSTHNDFYGKKVKQISNQIDCAKLMKDWLAFFRAGHMSLKRVENERDETEINRRVKNWQIVDVDVEQFTKYLESKKSVDYEGVWKVGTLQVGIKKMNENYVGFIIDPGKSNWSKGQLKLKINRDNSASYFRNDRAELKFKNAKLVGNVFLEMGYMSLKRISPEIESDSKIEEYIKSLKSGTPYFEEIDANTALLRIPTFYGAKTKIVIDSVVFAHKATILNTPNLIIDIRNNGGGSDRAYKELIPFLYTNPIRLVALEFLSTPLNNQRMLDFIKDPKWGLNEEEKKWAQDSYNILSKREGEFVNLDSTSVSITKMDTIYAYPKNIGIIINENNGSSAEQFLLAAKQSKKVKLFGTSTTGVLDISNMYFIKSPCEEYELGYCLTKSMRIPGMAIDNVGIQPDFFMDESIQDYEWIEYVTKILNN